MLRIIIVDDEPWGRKVIRALGKWEELGIEITGEAEDGIEALELIEAEKPDLVVLDMKMPGMDGVALLQEMEIRYSDIQVIAMSGYNDFVYLKQAISSRAVDYLLKPVDGDELNAALEKCKDRIHAARKSAMNRFGTLHLLEDEAFRARYLIKRQAIYEAMTALKKDRVIALVDELEAMFAFPVTVEVSSKIVHDFSEMLQEHLTRSGISLDMLKEWENGERFEAELAFEKIGDLYGRTIDELVDRQRSRKKLDVDQIADYMKRNYRDHLSLESLANRFFVSKEHLSRSFKVEKGITINEYLVKLRMDRARVLILDETLPLKEVAGMVGYPDVAYFYRVFKKYYGMAPGEFRNNNGSILSNPKC